MENQRWIVDERVGCVAVYQEPMRNCLEGIADDDGCVFFRGGTFSEDEGWTLDPKYSAWAHLLANGMNTPAPPATGGE